MIEIEHLYNDRRKSYKNYGKVYTGNKVANYMIDYIDELNNKNLKILEPSAGKGSFYFSLDTLTASLKIAESGIKYIFRFPYQNSLIKINDIFYKYPEVEREYDKIIKTISKNKYISIRSFINGLLLNKKDYWLIMLFEKNLIEFIKRYEGLSKSESKIFGEVFTAQALIEEMLDTLPKEVWSNKDLKWLDSCVGIGNFPGAILQRLMVGLEKEIPNEEERRKHILENMLFMGDISTKNLFLLYQLFDANNEFKLNVFRGDFLSEKFDNHMKNIWKLDGFDIIVGNPPYNDEKGLEGGGKNLYSKFIDKILKIIKENGFVSIVTNAGILKSTDNNRNNILDKLLSGNLYYLNINECKKHFPGVGGAMIFCYFTFENNQKYEKTRVVSQINKNTRIYDDIVSFEGLNWIPRISTKLSLSIIKKFMNNQYEFIRRDGVEKLEIEDDLIGFKRLSHLVEPYNVNPSDNIDKGTWILTKSENKEEDIKFFNSKEFSFINLIHRYDPIIYHKMLNIFGKNSENLTEDEIELIEDTIKDSAPKKKRTKKSK